jgi:hypothetical protein
MQCKIEANFEGLMTIYQDEYRDITDFKEVILRKGLKGIDLILTCDGTIKTEDP